MRAPLIIFIMMIALSTYSYAEEAKQNTANKVVQATVKAAKKMADNFAGYDFEQVVRRVESSVSPLQQEMNGSLKVFSESVEEAQQLMEQGKSKEAITKCSAAMDAVLDSRDKVLGPMWQGQDYLNEQIGKVRSRLAQAVESSGGTSDVKLDEKTEKLLDGIAGRIANENDELRKRRLVAHYKTIRQLSKIKQMAKQLSPNQRKLWRNVLGVLENTTLTHQQVLMGTEVLFAQFEATAQNLKEYEGLIDTVEGASRLLGVVKGLGESGQGLAAFSQNMMELQKRMAGFNSQIEVVLEDKMIDLEAQAEAISTSMAENEEFGGISAQVDDELTERLKKFESKN
jgi:cell fate (sporulation/competence/biofilm development) regulator YmcA (YheA/YmcA/DUF963 family)